MDLRNRPSHMNQMIQVRVRPDLVKAARHWAVEHRLSLGEAITELVDRGLAIYEREKAGAGTDKT